MNSPSIPTEPKPSIRPTAITIICVIGFIGALVAVPVAFTDAARSIGTWYPPYLAISAGIGFCCMMGLWQMRRWAVFAYLAFCMLNQVILFGMGFWSLSALLIPGIVIAISLSYLSAMK